MDNQNSPKVTVLMPVYNGEKYLSEAIESILIQNFLDFEFLIINDGSTDRSVQIIEKYTDPRIRLIHNPKNLGLASTLNKGLDIAQGQYIARMDCDDISYPDRLRKQVEFMDNHPEIGVCGTWAKVIAEDGSKRGKNLKHPIKHEEIKASLLFNSALAHPTVLLRKSMFREHNLYYNTSFVIAQDYELWTRCINLFHLANLPEYLIKYRFTTTSNFRSKVETHSGLLKQIYKTLFASLNLTLSSENYKIHRAISLYNFSDNCDFVKKVKQWLHQLYKANFKQKTYREPFLYKILANRWFWVCFFSAYTLGIDAWKTFYEFPLAQYNTISLKLKLKFAIKSLLGMKIGKI